MPQMRCWYLPAGSLDPVLLYAYRCSCGAHRAVGASSVSQQYHRSTFVVRIRTLMAFHQRQILYSGKHELNFAYTACKPYAKCLHRAQHYRQNSCSPSFRLRSAGPDHEALQPTDYSSRQNEPDKQTIEASIPPQQQPAVQEVQQQASAQPQATAAPEQQVKATQPAASPPRTNQTSQAAQPSATAQHAEQQQKPKQSLQQRFSWLSGLISLLHRVPASLVAFLAGGLMVCSLLWGWAKGSPLRKHHPYTVTMTFAEASKVDQGTPVRMKGVQIGQINKVKLQPSHIEAVAEVCDASNVIPLGSRVDINLLGLASDPWIDITPPAGCVVRKDHGPHHPDCVKDGLIVCNGGTIKGSQGGSTDFMMKFTLSNQDRTRQKTVDVVYHNKQWQQS